MIGLGTGMPDEKRRLPVDFSPSGSSGPRGRNRIALISIVVLALIPLLFAAAIPVLTISPTTITFPSLDPDAAPEIPALTPMAIEIRVTALKPEETWILEFCAASDLTSGADTIPISNVRWTISGTALPSGSFQNGSLVRNICQQAGIGPGDVFAKKADVAASVQFYLANSRSYAPGTYTAPVDVRVTVPGAVKTRAATLAVTIAPSISLTLGMAAINFRSADPDLFPSIEANENPITVTVQSQAGGNATLTCRAMGDLASGGDIIAAFNISWTATGLGFASGIMNATDAQLAGQWAGLGTWNGTFSFHLINSWSYAPGTYSVSVVYTLTVL
jgi:hypothetical protein